MAFTGESNCELVDGHHNGYMEDGETYSRCEIQEGPVYFTLEEVDALCNNNNSNNNN